MFVRGPGLVFTTRRVGKNSWRVEKTSPGLFATKKRLKNKEEVRLGRPLPFDTLKVGINCGTAKSAILILTFGAREAVSLWLNLRLSFRSSRIPSIIPGKVCQCEKLNLLLLPNFLNNHGHI